MIQESSKTLVFKPGSQSRREESHGHMSLGKLSSTVGKPIWNAFYDRVGFSSEKASSTPEGDEWPL